MSIMNYNPWFHKYHKYLTGMRNGTRTFNDTKWKTLNDRYSKLVDTLSSLMDEQPYNVLGNYAGFQRYFELMSKSNYTFEDLDRSLIETYRQTLQNAMGNTMVNTHAIIAKYRFNDKHVSHTKYDHYYVIDVPFTQLHFGERDEFVRQKLHTFYETESRYFMPSDRFLSNEISSILGFTIVCCANGFMTDDWAVGISEQGFRFKIGWRYSADAEFIIMKLDESAVYDCEVSSDKIRMGRTLTYSELGIRDPDLYIGKNCIVQIVDSNVRKEVSCVPNFGYFVEDGLTVPNMQQRTLNDLSYYRSTNAFIRIYIVKYLREVPGVFPAVNYYDMMSSKYVYTEDYDHIVNVDEKRIILQDQHVDDELPICTPPISLSRVSQDDNRHTVITNCYKVESKLVGLKTKIATLGRNVNNRNPLLKPDETLTSWYTTNVLKIASEISSVMQIAYLDYMSGSLMTALIPLDLVAMLQTEFRHFQKLSNIYPSYPEIQANTFDLLYEDNYDIFLKKICEPLHQPPFSTLGNIQFPDYFPTEPVCVNRPVSEQCFITLRYNTDEQTGCWVFDVPDIKHFHGIDNVFYIDSKLTGNELFKFMYLYTDTENPSERVMVNMSHEQLLDFDLFTEEVNKHMGYIRYWDASNRLMKLSEMFYRKHDAISELAILTKIMKHKIEGDVFLEYASDVNYELSNITSDFIHDYTETSERAPFTVNFLFYTLSLFYGNKNRMQSVLLQTIVNQHFYPRYADLKLSDIDTDLTTENVNYSVISYSPYETVQSDRSISSMPDTSDLQIFNGLQFPINPNTFTAYGTAGNVIRYPFVFNKYESGKSCYMLNGIGMDDAYFVKFSNVSEVMSEHPMTTYYGDAHFASMITVFLSEIYDGINDITTNYRSYWNCKPTIVSMKQTIEKRSNDIRMYINSGVQLRGLNVDNIASQFAQSYLSNPVYVKLGELESALRLTCGTITRQNNKTVTIYDTTQKLISTIYRIYAQSGFDRYAIRNIRALYLHLKQINQKLGLYQYKQWLDNCDLDTIQQLPDYLSDNPNLPFNPSEINLIITDFMATYNVASSHVNSVQTIIDSFLNNIQTSYLDTLIAYCDDVIQNHMFDFYVMNKIQFTQQINGEPAYAEIRISSNDSHVAWDIEPISDKIYAILAQVKYDMSSDVYQILEVIPTCENAFVDGTDTDVSIVFFDHNGNQIQVFNDIPVTFTKIGLSSDIRDDIQRYLNALTIPLETQNVHATFDVDSDDIIQKPHADLHYELLCGNHFTPLDHFSEYCAPPVNELQGPIDKMYLSCEQMNRLSLVDETNRPTQTMHFRACDVFHIEPVNGVMTSIGGKYFEGQILYAVTDDGLSLFPIQITSIDHSLERGFIEAKVLLQHTKWFETTDPTVMHKYLTTNITCTVVDDNIRNFLDEFSEYDGDMYIIPELRKNQHGELVELPGDPLFVKTNADYVYTRLAWMFHDDIKNRFDTDIQHHFVYIGSGEVVTNDREIYVNMVNHNFNTHTLPELYPILRTEPDDHRVWDEERKTFKREIANGQEHMSYYIESLGYLYGQLAEATTEYDKQQIRLQIEDYQLKMLYWRDYTKRMEEYLIQLESPTTWYNVRAYDDALVYINNGRAHISKTFIPHVQDLPYSDRIQVLLYDWDKKEWIDPNMYTVTVSNEDGISIDPVCDSTTDNVLATMTIQFESAYKSNRILIYFAYASSDVFDDIPLHDMECTVRFQPVLNASKITGETPYENIRIRKHYDENETYMPSKLQPLPESFGDVNGFTFERPDRSGLYTTGSPIRFGDMIVHVGQTEYKYTDFDIYIENPLKDIMIPQTDLNIGYDVTTVHVVDHYEPGHEVTLVTVNNDDDVSFGQSASSAMFVGVTTENGIEIQHSIGVPYQTREYTCAILPNSSHPMIGGVYTIAVSISEQQLPNVGDWIHLSEESENGISTLEYRLIPKKVALVPKDGVTLDGTAYVTLQNHYETNTSHEVSKDNTNVNDLYTYYYDKEKNVRYPVGDVLTNSHQNRFTLNLESNQNVESIRSNFIGVCRYATQKIPQNGIIDLTGLIPTPLSRDRYEFWVNGRYVDDPSQIIILSPTTFQLRNMTSLKNLDVVELVDDFGMNVVNRLGPTYVDLNGKTYGSYMEILRNHADIVDQSVTFMFRQDVHSNMDSYLYDEIRESHNRDYEPDIMDFITNPEITSYNQLHNIPTINGVSIFNLRTCDIGLQEIPNREILDAFDKAWKLEGLNGITPFKHMSAYIDTIGEKQTLHVKKNEIGYEIYTTGLSDECFTIYISKNSHADISDTTHTLQIIPMIRPGTHVIINESLAGNWIHSTIPDTTPIKIE